MFKKLPYVLLAPDWVNNSAGVRNCHYLAYLLNCAGYDCALVGSHTKPGWTTPRLMEQQEQIDHWLDEGAVFILPEMYEGLPFGARRRVVRWLHNKPGHFTGTQDIRYAEYELVVPFTRMLNTIGAVDEDILWLYQIEDFFRPTDHRRDRACRWIGHKGVEVPIDDSYWRGRTAWMETLTRDWPLRRETLAEIFQASHVCYSFDDWTALNYEATLCGCPVVLISAGNFSRETYEQSELGLNGIAWGDSQEELTRALETLPAAYRNFHRMMQYVPERVARFIRRTQLHFNEISPDRINTEVEPCSQSYYSSVAAEPGSPS